MTTAAAAARSGLLFLIFTLFTAPLFSMVSFTPGGERGGGYMQQASAQEQSTPAPPAQASPPNLPFTPFSPPTNDTGTIPGGGGVTEEPPPTVLDETSPPPPPAATNAPLGPLLPIEPPTTSQGEDQSAGGEGGSNAGTVMWEGGNIQIVFKYGSLSPGGSEFFVDCPAGTIVTGGGFASQSGTVRVSASYPAAANTWSVIAHDDVPFSYVVVLYAICAKIVSTAQQMIPATAPPLTNDTGTANTTLATNDTETIIPPTNDTGTTTLATNDTGVAASSASEPPLIAEIIANATQAYTGATIRLDANITGGAPPYSYSWSVPDIGVIDQDRSITQMFFEPGTFTYLLTAIDSRGKTVNDAVQIVIQERLPQGGIVAPEPEGIAPPPTEEGVPMLEPEVPVAPPPTEPPPTVPEGEEATGVGEPPEEEEGEETTEEEV